MKPEELENWQRVKTALEAADKTDNFYYKRAIAILQTGKDPLDLSERYHPQGD